MSEAYCIVRVRICKDGTLYFLADSWALYSRVLCLPSVYPRTSSWILMRRFNCRTLQFIVSPKIGSLSDKYGRKRILLLTMIGNILSAVVYVYFSFERHVKLANVLVDGFSPPVLDRICFPE